MQQNFSGFVRVFEYYSSNDGATADYATRMWEGEIKEGEP